MAKNTQKLRKRKRARKQIEKVRRSERETTNNQSTQRPATFELRRSNRIRIPFGRSARCRGINKLRHRLCVGRKSPRKTRNDCRRISKENNGSPPVQQLCHIDRLPPEILDNIFGHLEKLTDRNSVRLVCRPWYHICSRRETLRIRIRGNNHCPLFLENSGFEHLKIYFESVSVNELSSIFLQKVGPKIHKLEFIECQLGSQVLQNVILFCINLQSLRIVLSNGRVNEVFCEPAALEMITVERKHLESLEIDSSNYRNNYHLIGDDNHPIEDDFGIWKQIFQALCVIFPNVIHYTYSHSGLQLGSQPSSIKCTFSSDPHETSKSNLGLCLALFMCTHTQGWREAWRAFSAIRLTAISLHFRDGVFTKRDTIAVGNLFKNQKKLMSVKILTPERFHGFNPCFILGKIVDNCCKLRSFQFNLHSFTYRRKDQKLISKLLNIENFSFGSIKRSGLTLFVNNRFYSVQLLSSMPNLNYVQHLTLIATSDDLLQYFFQYMTNLRTLDIVKIYRKITNSGFTGRISLSCENPSNSGSTLKNSANGYSINRLRNLERLEIGRRGRCCGLTDAIYNEFDFPKLQYLHCFPPQDPSVFNFLPSLRDVNFTEWSLNHGYGPPPVDVSAEYLLSFCRFTKNLHILRVHHKAFSLEEVKPIFENCPSLRILHSRDMTDYYEPLTKAVRRVERTDTYSARLY